MWAIRILFLLLLISVLMSAQSSPDKSSISPQFEIRALTAPPSFRRNSVSAPSQNGQNQMAAAPLERLLEPSPSQQDRSLAEPFRPEATSVCFYIRTYRVKRDDPQSDITTPAGYSECQSNTRLELQDAVVSPAFR